MTFAGVDSETDVNACGLDETEWHDAIAEFGVGSGVIGDGGSGLGEEFDVGGGGVDAMSGDDVGTQTAGFMGDLDGCFIGVTLFGVLDFGFGFAEMDV